MLDMNLVQGRPALEVEFQLSLAVDLFHDTGLVMDAPWYEGFDPWVYATHAALPPSLKRDMDVVLLLVQKSYLFPLWISQRRPDDPIHKGFGAFAAWLNALTEDDVQSLIESTLTSLCGHCEGEPVSLPSLEDTNALEDCLRVKFSEKGRLDRAVQLVRNPVEFKAGLISVFTRFWEQFYRQEYERCLPLAERSVEYHRRQNYGADLLTVFSAVTGRRFPKEPGDYEEVERVVFVPSCHIGPYTTFAYFKEPRPVLMLRYNCRPTATPERDQAPAIQDIFPPLKALSDETRLQILSILDGRELYAQEIVERLDISQSAVSRHLKLMLAGGLLAMRKQDNMKYFSINAETLAALAERLKSFRKKTQ